MVTSKDLAIYVYNYAVLLSGAYIIIGLGFDGRVELFVIGAIIALFWTAYFKWRVASKLVGGEEEEEEDATDDISSDT